MQANQDGAVECSKTKTDVSSRLWATGFPFNKMIYSISYALFTGGAAGLVFTAFYYAVSPVSPSAALTSNGRPFCSRTRASLLPFSLAFKSGLYLLHAQSRTYFTSNLEPITLPPE